MQSFVWVIAASGLVPPLPPTLPGPVRPAAFASYQPVLAAAIMPLAQRPKAIAFSEGYYTRLKIHRYASIAMVPMFVTEYFLGRSLYNQTAPPDTAPVSQSLRSWHGVVADGIGVLFAVNTVTGTWNLWEGRAVSQGRTRRYVHAAVMLISDAGMVATGLLAPGGRDLQGLGDPNRRRTHRIVAIASMSTALVGDLMMLVWNKH
jgi:hypothetical protein